MNYIWKTPMRANLKRPAFAACACVPKPAADGGRPDRDHTAWCAPDCGVHDAVMSTSPVRSDIPCAPVFFNETIGLRPGYVAGQCGHAVALSEWRAGFRVCERCPRPTA